MRTRIRLAWAYRATLQAVFNLVFNLWHLVRIIATGRLPSARYRLAIHRAGLLSGTRPLMTYQFVGITKGTGTLGKWPCWTALPIVFSGMGCKGNCMDGAYYIKRILGGKVRVWIPEGKRWYARVHYVCVDKDGRIWSLEGRGLIVYQRLSSCRRGGRWI